MTLPHTIPGKQGRGTHDLSPFPSTQAQKHCSPSFASPVHWRHASGKSQTARGPTKQSLDWSLPGRTRCGLYQWEPSSELCGAGMVFFPSLRQRSSVICTALAYCKNYPRSLLVSECGGTTPRNVWIWQQLAMGTGERCCTEWFKRLLQEEKRGEVNLVLIQLFRALRGQIWNCFCNNCACFPWPV